LQLYNSLAIKREDTARRQALGPLIIAPLMRRSCYSLEDDIMQTLSYLDYGMFLQSVLLSVMAEGLATCPQAALAEYPDIIRQTLNYPNSKQVLCGIALGYEDSQDPVNQYRTERENTSQFTDFFD